MHPCRLRRFSRILITFVVLTLTACSTLVPVANTPRQLWEDRLRGSAVILLGEVHDNATLHADRLQVLRRALEAGWRPVLAMEQFDIDRQADLDRARVERPLDVDYLIRRADTSPPSWDWSLYRPVLALALKYGLPIRAANLSRREANRLVRNDYEAVFGAARSAQLGLQRPLDPGWQAAQEHEIDLGHCGALPKTLIPGMARAQFARDAVMADVLRRNSQAGVVLIAGNGHARRDTAVPRWLGDLPADRLWSAGFVEPHMALQSASQFDTVITSAAAGKTRAVDPCVQLRKAQGTS